MGNCQKIEGPQVAQSTCGPNNQEVTMEQGPVRMFHVHATVVFEWKMAAVFVSAYIIRLLIK